VSSVEERLDRVRQRIARAATKGGRDPASVTLIGATKSVDADRIRTAVRAGLRDLGENRVQEALPKIAAVGEGSRWHLIGHLQRNKVRQAVRAFTLIHSVDTAALTHALDRAGRQTGRPVPVLIEVNVGGETTKFGVAPGATEDLLSVIARCTWVEAVGLMTVAPPAHDPQIVRPVFRALRELRDRLRRRAGEGFQVLSMGMSDDFEVAVEEGATMVRIGRAIFGERVTTATGEATSRGEGPAGGVR
jgi:pyridoxal phosphate enzyme (YggS family)